MNGLLAPMAVTLLVGLGVGFAFQPEFSQSATFWFVMIGAYIPLSIWSVRRARARSRLSILSPRFGDLTVGIILGLALAAGGFLVLANLAPTGSPNQGWLFRVYAHVGNVQQSPWLIGGVCILALLEELTWRELVLDSLAERWGHRLAIPSSALLYSVSHAPALWTLADQQAGLNPLLVLGALGAGVVWSFLAVVLRRLPPVVLSHIVFSYFLSSPLPSIF